MFFTEFWVQEFAKKGGGTHTRSLGQSYIRIFFFKVFRKNIFSYFSRSRAGAMMTKLPQKDGSKISSMSDK